MTVGRRAGAVWGVVGIVALLGDALARVGPYAIDAVADGLTGGQWVVLVAWVAVMVVVEGHRGFHRQFSPRVEARAEHLARDGRGVELVLAPVFCLGLFRAGRRELVGSWLLVLGIVALVVAVARLDQPWRGIVDAGVFAGLAYGLVSLVLVVTRARPGLSGGTAR